MTELVRLHQNDGVAMKTYLSVPKGLLGHAESSAEIWDAYLPRSSHVRMTTGYITSDAIIELKKIAEFNNNFSIELFIGMHFFELFTRTQYEAVSELSSFLIKSQRGAVYLSSRTKFHGKMYSFLSGDQCIASAIGSSNLGSFIGTSSDLYETDCCFDDHNSCNEINGQISKIIESLGTPFSSVNIDKFNEQNEILRGEYGVDQVDPGDVAQAIAAKTKISFDLPLKTTGKSNLNAFFGEGRKNKRGIIKPRPWYEAEIIVPVSVTRMPNYPVDQEFDVITTDGWKFRCKVSKGANGKNFRSANDLKILGKWIKGSMEKAGALKIGTPVTDDTLAKFQKSALRLTRTTQSGLWILEMVK